MESLPGDAAVAEDRTPMRREVRSGERGAVRRGRSFEHQSWTDPCGDDGSELWPLLHACICNHAVSILQMLVSVNSVLLFLMQLAMHVTSCVSLSAQQCVIVCSTIKVAMHRGDCAAHRLFEQAVRCSDDEAGQCHPRWRLRHPWEWSENPTVAVVREFNSQELNALVCCQR